MRNSSWNKLAASFENASKIYLLGIYDSEEFTDRDCGNVIRKVDNLVKENSALAYNERTFHSSRPSKIELKLRSGDVTHLPRKGRVYEYKKNGVSIFVIEALNLVYYIKD